ncbi:hypothetical protein D9615_005741 [Tricholomella constricta]|uniref:Uncharacterized protein n=1 Tax=Tricholomella constricta TaxID=117010 RepID=A0A8H5HAJ6_9AGAR|nr:hypothetical protein D9615_005741 [Tricholomella constricta]
MNINWKGDPPKGDLKTKCEDAVKEAATSKWQSGTAAGKTFVEVTIRGADHSTTTVNGRRVPDARHITASYKTLAEQRSGRHIPAHIYLDGQRPDFDIDNVQWFSEKRDPRTYEDEIEDGGEEVEETNV